MKNVLWITGIFPPINCGIGRQVKLAKYLPDHGWNPIVLAFDKSLFRTQMDEGLLEDVKHLEVHRTKSGESRLLQQTLPMWLRRFGVDTHWWRTPDPWIRWKGYAVRRAEDIRLVHKVARKPIDAIFSSAPPYTCHLVAQEIKKITGIPWIADYRDVWTQTDKSYSIKSQEQVRREEVMEEAVLRETDWMTIVNDVVLEMQRSKFPFIREKSSCISHGYDPEDYESIELGGRPHVLRDVCVMTFAGTLYGERTKGAEAFLKALKQFYDEEPRAELKVQFMGNCRAVENVAGDLGLCNRAGYRAAFIPWADKKRALGIMAQSDVLLFILGDSPLDRHATPGKLYDYLGVGKPILAVCPEGIADQIILNSNMGATAPPDDVEKIRRLIGGFVSSHQKGEFREIEKYGNKRLIEQYDVRNKAREMAEVLERIVR